MYNLKKKKSIKLPKLRSDIGDLDKLKSFFPFKIREGFNGDLININFINLEKTKLQKVLLLFDFLNFVGMKKVLHKSTK